MTRFFDKRPHHRPQRRRDLILAGVVTMVTVAGLVVAGAVYISPPGQTIYSAKLVNTGGLEAGDQVRIAGIRKGKVASVDLTGTFITVRFRLDDSIAVRSDATANVRLITPIGGRVLDLDPGSGPSALDGAIPLEQTSSTYDISSTLETTTPVFRDVRGVDLRRTAALLQNAFSDGNTNIPDALQNASSLMDLLQRQYAQLDKTMTLSDEYVAALANRKQVLVDFLRQLSFLARTLGPDIANVQNGFDYLRRLFKLLTRPLVAYRDGIEPSVQQFKTLLNKVSAQMPAYANALTQVDQITRRLSILLDAPEVGPASPEPTVRICIPSGDQKC
ncbi:MULTISPECIES: MlaD family protein [Gordonia]|uniref:MlaD family protein n=3 Tax=Gordonia TaxID=2053 RepID=A0ABU4DFZ2_9ACTN|nr:MULTISPECIES: MlaD family protein [Gordonia]ATD69657.1 MCE family protein [Gordonia sp. 1D]MCX2967068.1 MlaD family protein [Gordonia aquimaris]MCZ0911664.1 MlaD family protein [Gordonia amicalis]MCZ4581850.1 MlaD family protein [Gordonia amicalis]MDJ0010382.1 MlaD family protein [Gordonia alkanivorans]